VSVGDGAEREDGGEDLHDGVIRITLEKIEKREGFEMLLKLLLKIIAQDRRIPHVLLYTFLRRIIGTDPDRRSSPSTAPGPSPRPSPHYPRATDHRLPKVLKTTSMAPFTQNYYPTNHPLQLSKTSPTK
jgi:hypothetical protein